MSDIKVNTKVIIKPEHYDEMKGTIIRIVKNNPNGEEEPQALWQYHVEVKSNHPRNSGLFVMKYYDLVIEKE